jgi:hypothetical protein
MVLELIRFVAEDEPHRAQRSLPSVLRAPTGSTPGRSAANSLRGMENRIGNPGVRTLFSREVGLAVP